MYTVENSKHFVKRQDESGAIYYVLSTHIAPLQQGFYFVNPSMDDEAKYLWFYCIFPPASYRTLGVVDFTTAVDGRPDVAVAKTCDILPLVK